MQAWIWLWTFVWYAGIGVFSVLSLLVIWFGGRDLMDLLQSLKARHLRQQASPDAAPTTSGEPAE
jgi:hypothetical protein